MMNITRLAAIDIGSNAIRLLITNIFDVDNEPHFQKVALIRLPIRLGNDVFLNNKISKINEKRMIQGMRAYSDILRVYDIHCFKAYATSAMRNAINKEKIIKKIKKEAKIKVEVIDGTKEAEIIFNAGLSEMLDPTKAYIYIDVGGGSTELTIFSGGKVIKSHSFRIGTVRFINDMIPQELFQGEFKEWIVKYTKGFTTMEAIGSGGNINKIYKLSQLFRGEALSRSFIDGLYQEMSALSYEERIVKFDLKEDRADVIVPAAHIFASVMKWANIEKIHVPMIGLADGMVRKLYEETT